MAYINVWERPGFDDYFMRSTVFTSQFDRATRYASEDEAAQAKAKARQFYAGRLRAYDKQVRTVDADAYMVRK